MPPTGDHTRVMMAAMAAASKLEMKLEKVLGGGLVPQIFMFSSIAWLPIVLCFPNLLRSHLSAPGRSMRAGGGGGGGGGESVLL